MTIGEKIFELRRARNLSQENLADILGVTRQTVSKWETNQSLPDLDKVMPLCKVFEIGVEELLGNASGVTSDGIANVNETVDAKADSEKSKNESDSVKEKFRKRSAVVVSGAIFAYVFAVALLIAGVAAWGWNPITTVSVFLIIIGGATAAIIWNFLSIPKSRKQKPIAGEQKIISQINGIIWSVVVVLYFVISFPTGAWHITWLIFVIGALCSKIAELVMALSDKNKDDKNGTEKSEQEQGDAK